MFWRQQLEEVLLQTSPQLASFPQAILLFRIGEETEEMRAEDGV